MHVAVAAPPTITALSPTNNATAVEPEADLVATFSEDVGLAAGGVIVVTNLTDQTATTITLPDSQVSVSTSNLTISLTAQLDLSDIYAITIDGSSVSNAAAEFFAGYSDTNTWQFTVTTNPNWSLIAYWPLNDGNDGDSVASADDIIDDAGYPETDGASSGSTDTWEYDLDRRRIVYSTTEDDRLDAGDSLMNQDFTWSVWAKSVGGDAGPLLGTRNGSYLRLYLTTINGSYIGTLDFSDFNDNEWHHLVLTREDNLFSVYVDGEFEASKTSSAGDNTMRFEIGGTSRYSEDFEGLMSDAAVWKETLSTNRISLLYAGGDILLSTTNAPVVSSFSPTNNATNVDVSADLEITFDQNPVAWSGNITLTNLTDNSSIIIAVTNTSQVLISSNVFTINPSTNLTTGHVYAVLIDATAIRGGYGEYFAGISDTNTWRFTTALTDVFAPTLVSVDPPLTDNDQILAGSDLIFRLSEEVMLVNGGVITLTNLTDNTSSNITIPDAQVTVGGEGNEYVTINPAGNLHFGDTYAVLIDGSTVADLRTNYFAGISSTSTWNFTTDPKPYITSLDPADDTTNVFASLDFEATFSEDIVLVNGGVITLTNISVGSASNITIPDSRITVSGSILTIDPDPILELGDQYAILIDATSVEDLAGNPFDGITSTSTWSFLTRDGVNWSLIAYWPLNDGADGDPVTTADDVIDDATRPETDGASQGGTDSWTNDAQRGIVYRTTEDDRLDAGDTIMHEDFTWSVWAKSVSGDDGPLLGTRNGSFCRLYLTQINGTYVSIGFADFDDNDWHHMIFQREGNAFRVYVDGTLEGSTTSAAGNNTMRFEIGGSSRYSEDFNGYMSDAAVWAEALSEERIQELANGGPVILSGAKHGTLFQIR